ncbi:hypothetical protein [Salipaludibacillus aurantiacus]|uniref:Uncharacterized protein n=1 Tax=Salipaludibacillus aurantiacus TaxID=1601833 RepID=A0A1H9S641_9BACI|nr:hypothetical protein [Salipaludibacillus aurantiacus]SER80526.1 hypothetical protein SAMN05518684_10449 [Salipaludibacillus aurantiacus]
MKKLIGYSFAAGLLISGGIIYATYSLTDNYFGSSEETATASGNASENVSGNASEEIDLDTSAFGNDENEEAANDEDEKGGNPDGVYFLDTAIFDLERSDHEDAINFKDGQEERAEENIDYMHNVMNDIVGYGNVDTLDFDDVRNGEYHDTKKFMEGIMELQDDLLDDSRAIKDIDIFENFYKLAVSHHTEDRMALRYAHRIIHDLDIYVNGDGSDDDRRIWGVTQAFGDDDRIESMYNYLRDHAQ